MLPSLLPLTGFVIPIKKSWVDGQEKKPRNIVIDADKYFDDNFSQSLGVDDASDSLAGIPLTGGFFAKYYVLMAAVEQGRMLWVVVFAVLMAAISVYYYFRVIMSMYFKQGDVELIEEPTTIEKTLLIINAAIIIALGILPSVIMR